MVDGGVLLCWGLSRRFLLEVVAFEAKRNGNGERKKAKQLEYEKKEKVFCTWYQQKKTPPTFHSIDCERNS